MLTISTTSFAQELTLELAKKIAARAEKYASENNWKVSVAIVNAEGNLTYFQRSDGSYLGSAEMSVEKAKSSNAFQRPTSAFTTAVKGGRTELLSGKSIVAIEGGVPLILNGKHIGAIGVSGARSVEDEEIANNAVEALHERR